MVIYVVNYREMIRYHERREIRHTQGSVIRNKHLHLNTGQVCLCQLDQHVTYNKVVLVDNAGDKHNHFIGSRTL